MAIASVGTMGTGVSSTSASSFTLATITNALASGDFAMLTVVTDNSATATGYSSTHQDVSGGTGRWTKLGEYTYSPTSAAADGVTVSLWVFEASAAVATSTTITITLSAAVTDKVASMWKFTKTAASSIRLVQMSTANGIPTTVAAGVGFGSAVFSGLASASRLYFRGLGKETSSTTALTVSTNFTQITNNRSRNNAAAVSLWGEFRVNTSTGETSNPTMATAADSVGLFAALEEYTPAASVAYEFQTSTTSCFTDTAGTVAVTADGDLVACIRDKNTSIILATQATSASRPFYRTGGGKPYLDFSGGSTSMRSPFPVQITDGNGSHSVGAAVYYSTNTGTQIAVSADDLGGTGLRLSQMIRNNAGTAEVVVFTPNGGNVSDIGPAIAAATGVVQSEITQSSNTAEAFVAGAGNGTTSISPTATGPVYVTLGGDRIYGYQIYQGSITSPQHSSMVAALQALMPSGSIALVVQAASCVSQVEVPTLSPKTSIAPAAAASAGSAGNVTIAFHNQLIVSNDASSTTTTSVASISVRYALPANAAASSSVADSAVTVPRWVLSPAAASSSSTEDAPTLAAKTSLVPGAALTATITGSPTLAPKTVLALAAAASAGAVDNVASAAKTSITAAAAISAGAAGSPVLSSNYAIGPAAASSLSSTDAPAIVPRWTLTPAAGSSASVVDNGVLAFRIAIAGAAAASSSVADPVVITPRWALALAAATSLSVAGSVVLASKTVLSIAPGNSAGAADSIVLSPRTTLSAAAAVSTAANDNVTLTVGLVPAAAQSASTAGSPTLVPRWILAPAAAVSLSFADNGTVVPAGSTVVAAAVSPSFTTSPTIAPRTSVAPAAASSSSVAGSVTIASSTSIAPAGPQSLSTATSPALGLRYVLALANGLSASTADGIAIAAGTGLLADVAVSFSTATNVPITTVGPTTPLLPDGLVSASVVDGLALVAHATAFATLRLRIAA